MTKKHLRARNWRCTRKSARALLLRILSIGTEFRLAAGTVRVVSVREMNGE